MFIQSANKFAKHLSTEINKRQKTREEKAEEKMRKLETNISTTDGVQVTKIQRLEITDG